MSSEVVSLDRFEGEFEISGVGIRSTLELPPYVPAESIVFDLGRLARTCRVGRIDDITIGHFSEHEETITPQITGVDDNGTATGTAIKSRAKTRRADTQIDGASGLHPRVSATIKINREHPDLDDKNLRSPKTWSTLIDQGLREGLRKANKDHMFANRSLFDVLYGSWLLGNWAMDGYDSVANRSITEGLVTHGALVAGANMLFAALYKQKHGDLDFEWSTTPMLPYDRILLLQGLTRTQKIVKTVNTPS